MHHELVIVNTLSIYCLTSLKWGRFFKVDSVLTTIDCESSLNFAKAVTPDTDARRTTTKED
ncbi:hypothetical protein A5779_17075 [Mycolicibacterium peregrinum]|uniref:Uncharacterized protein n=1 Tax=Mycolicibacterium peregrinum TaxID=43304 RepID=A0A1A0VVD4_MYCPR|nr:hypothetical protein A5779_02015 [Mycolicibacterium peregrinum]OBB96574.1 hypothetical protein A5779_17075 [Mycolicibacterium peregrinum]